MFTPNLIPNKRGEREMTRKNVNFDAVCFSLVLIERERERERETIYFFSVNTKIFHLIC